MDAAPMSGGASRGRLPGLPSLALPLVVLGLLGIWNEIRFQGCVERRTALEVAVINAADGKNPLAEKYAQAPQQCFRIPLKGD